MAWIKEWEHPDTGSIGNYWEMETILYNHRTKLSEMRVSVWVSAFHYHTARQSMHTITYIIPSGLAPQLAAGAATFTTAYVMAQPEFEGAVLYVPEVA